MTATTPTKAKAILIRGDESLSHYSHCVGNFAAIDLRRKVKMAEKLGFVVLSGTSYRHTVPTCYRGAYKIHAPAWTFTGTDRRITLTDMMLQNRSRSADIPCSIVVKGNQPTPKGWKCVSRSEEQTDFRVS